VLNEDDSVWLSTQNLKTDRLSEKLDHKMIGPYKALHAHGDAYMLDLPAHIAINPTLHASLLHKDPGTPYRVNIKSHGRQSRLMIKTSTRPTAS
jgi:hypothetical protein